MEKLNELKAGDDLITPEEIHSLRKTSLMGRKIVFFEDTDSTNTQAKRLAKGRDWDGTLVLSECQTSGKGRLGRSWSSPRGSGIWMSLLLKPRVSLEKISALTLIAALSVHRTLRKICQEGLMIKWPNDLVIKGKKVCGILTEMSSSPEGIYYVIVGLGINVNTESFPEEIRETAASVCHAAGHKVKRAPLVSDFLSEFEELYFKFEKEENLSFMREEYQAYLANMNERVRILKPGEEWEGTARGIGDMGELLVENEKGEIEAVISGEVSVRGVYGYV